MKESMLTRDFLMLHKPNHSKVPSELEQMYEKTQRADDSQHWLQEKNAGSQKFK